MVLRKSGRVDSRRFRMRVQAKATLDDESRFSFESAFFVLLFFIRYNIPLYFSFNMYID